MLKKILLILLVFSAGFFTHALFFPDFLANGITFIPKDIPLGTTAPTQEPLALHTFMTRVDFDGEHFSRHNITIEYGSYLIITNTSPDKLMWLESNNPLLATPRGYGESETIQARLDGKGQFIVADKNNPQERMFITVK